MATLRFPDENRTITEPQAVRDYLASIGIDYERWEPAHAVAADAPAGERSEERRVGKECRL